MPRTKQINKQLEEKIVLEDEEEDVAKDAPVKVERKPKLEKLKTKEEEYTEALKNLLLRLGSLSYDDLMQLSFVALKVRDPLAKGMAYYDSTIPTIEEQSCELIEWYINRCNADIKQCEAYIKELEEKKKSPAPTPVVSKVATLKKKTWVDKIFGSPKVRVLPELEEYDAQKQLKELKERLAELEIMKISSLVSIDTSSMYFKKWAFSYLLLCRSQVGEDNFLKMNVMLADGQIVNKQEGGMLSPDKVFLR